ncbi:hypothetical protein [Aeromonas hydrophila]|nr:hypothetical protein [Aeromonas hydrophila]MBS4674051.1 hypothetical protein [Aeromonas hydrophila]SUU33022.1 Uncharacterised protein [Aeromonas hydrophila]
MYKYIISMLILICASGFIIAYSDGGFSKCDSSSSTVMLCYLNYTVKAIPSWLVPAIGIFLSALFAHEFTKKRTQEDNIKKRYDQYTQDSTSICIELVNCFEQLSEIKRTYMSAIGNDDDVIRCLKLLHAYPYNLAPCKTSMAPLCFITKEMNSLNKHDVSNPIFIGKAVFNYNTLVNEYEKLTGLANQIHTSLVKDGLLIMNGGSCSFDIKKIFDENKKSFHDINTFIILYEKFIIAINVCIDILALIINTLPTEIDKYFISSSQERFLLRYTFDESILINPPKVNIDGELKNLIFRLNLPQEIV